MNISERAKWIWCDEEPHADEYAEFYSSFLEIILNLLSQLKMKLLQMAMFLQPSTISLALTFKIQPTMIIQVRE